MAKLKIQTAVLKTNFIDSTDGPEVLFDRSGVEDIQAEKSAPTFLEGAPERREPGFYLTFWSLAPVLPVPTFEFVVIPLW
jgi:hypothetical protein